MNTKFSVVKGLKPKAHVTATFLRQTTSLGCWQLPLSRCYSESHSFKKVFTTFLPHQYLDLGLWSCDCTIFESTTKGILSNLTFYGSCSPLSVQTQSTKTYECRQAQSAKTYGACAQTCDGHKLEEAFRVTSHGPAISTSTASSPQRHAMHSKLQKSFNAVGKDMRCTPMLNSSKDIRLWHKYNPRTDSKTDAFGSDFVMKLCSGTVFWLSEQIASSWLQLPFVCQITLSSF